MITIGRLLNTYNLNSDGYGDGDVGSGDGGDGSGSGEMFDVSDGTFHGNGRGNGRGYGNGGSPRGNGSNAFNQVETIAHLTLTGDLKELLRNRRFFG